MKGSSCCGVGGIVVMVEKCVKALGVGGNCLKGPDVG